jgi:hypothetical protein
MVDNYLTRKLLNNVSYCISNDYIIITAPHTEFISVKRLKLIDLDSLLQSYTDLVKPTRKRKIKLITRYTAKQLIKLYWETYLENFRIADALFDNMVNVFSLVEKRGIHSGYSDDEVFRLGMKLTNRYQSLQFDGVISKVINFYGAVRNNLFTLNNDYSPVYTKIIRLS